MFVTFILSFGRIFSKLERRVLQHNIRKGMERLSIELNVKWGKASQELAEPRSTTFAALTGTRDWNSNHVCMPLQGLYPIRTPRASGSETTIAKCDLRMLLGAWSATDTGSMFTMSLFALNIAKRCSCDGGVQRLTRGCLGDDEACRSAQASGIRTKKTRATLPEQRRPANPKIARRGPTRVGTSIATSATPNAQARTRGNSQPMGTRQVI